MKTKKAKLVIMYIIESIGFITIFISGLIISIHTFIFPAIVTLVIGTILFSIAVNKITNYKYNHVMQNGILDKTLMKKHNITYTKFFLDIP